MAILDDIKTALRIATATTDFNGEIQDLIDGAEADLQLAGIAAEKVVTTDPLIKRAVVAYCKANFGYDNPDADRLQNIYQSLKMHLSLSVDYVNWAVVFTVTAGGLPVHEACVTLDDGSYLLTNSLGVATFTITELNTDMDYTVSMSGYVSVEGSVLVNGSKAVGVVLVAA